MSILFWVLIRKRKPEDFAGFGTRWMKARGKKPRSF
jgi:hypothetical protein